MTTAQWVEKGCIPGPFEAEELFLKRTRLLKEQRPLPGCISEMCGMNPSWMHILYSNKGLSLWHGGMTSVDEEGVTVQLRKKFQKKGKFLFYKEKEIIAHEAIHAMRCMFAESRFEEVIAYQTASSSFRRYWGPLFRTPLESILFLVVTFLGGLALTVSLWSLPFWLFLVFVLMARLIRTQTVFKRCQNKLIALTGSSKKALAMLMHLTDDEILSLSSSSIEEIKAILRFPPEGLRWKQIVYISSS